MLIKSTNYVVLTFAASTAIGSAYFGLGTGPINFDNVQCVGTEQSLFDCTLLTTHNCGHSEDASVVCLATSGTSNIAILAVEI